MHFICRSFLGKNQNDTWSQYWENEPDNPLTKSTKGHLFGLISLSAKEVDDINSLGHDIIDEINHNYFSRESSNPLSDLEDLLQKISQKEAYQGYQFKITLLVIIDSQAFIAILGDHQIFLNRQDKISCLLSGKNNEVLSISGPIKSQDRIFITSTEFLDIITLEKLKNILADSKVQNIEENLLSILYSSNDESSSSATLIEICQDENVQTSETTENIISVTSLETDKPIFASHQQPGQIGKRKKIQIIIALFLIVGLFISFYLGHQKNQKIKTETRFQELKTEIEKQIESISVVKKLNLTDAQNQAKETQKLIGELVNLNVHPDEVSQLQSQVDLILSQTGVSDSFTPEMYYDTSLITSNPQYNQLSLINQNLYLLDTDKGRVDLLNLSGKSNKNISISDKIKSAKKIAVDQNNVYLLMSDGVYLVTKDELTQKIDFSQSSPSPNPVDFKIWNGAIYALDSNQNTIWKFNSTASGFSDSQNWLKNEATIDSGNVSMSIDGKVWLLSKDGYLTNYISGVKDNFKNPSNLKFVSTHSLSLDSDSDILAFLDEQNFVYVYKKDGEFVSQYNLSSLKISDIVLDGANNIIYLLATDQKIYKISL